MPSGYETDATVVFASLPGSTAFSANQTPTAVATALNAHFRELGDAVLAHDGQIIKFVGDALLATFLPLSEHTHHTVRAVRALFAAQSSEARPFTAGVHSGTVYLGPIGHPRHMATDVIGYNVNLALRTLQEAGGQAGSIVITEETYTHCQQAIECQDLGTYPVKGGPTPVRLYQVQQLR